MLRVLVPHGMNVFEILFLACVTMETIIFPTIFRGGLFSELMGWATGLVGILLFQFYIFIYF